MKSKTRRHGSTAAWVLPGSSAFLPQRHQLVALGSLETLNCPQVWMWAWMVVCVTPLWQTGALSRLDPASRPQTAAIGSGPRDPDQDKRKRTDGWKKWNLGSHSNQDTTGLLWGRSLSYLIPLRLCWIWRLVLQDTWPFWHRMPQMSLLNWNKEQPTKITDVTICEAKCVFSTKRSTA